MSGLREDRLTKLTVVKAGKCVCVHARTVTVYW